MASKIKKKITQTMSNEMSKINVLAERCIKNQGLRASTSIQNRTKIDVNLNQKF